jgi:hypothetical protein
MRAASDRSSRFKRVAGSFVIALVFAVAAAPTFIRTWSGQKTPDDFHVVYSGARAMLDRAEIYAATHGMYIYSPFLAFVFQPLALLPERVAAIAWLILIAIIILAATIIASHKIIETWELSPLHGDHSNSCLVSAGALLLIFEKIRSEFILGQTDCLILFGLALILCWLDRHPRLAAIAVGATANFKYLALIFVPYFVIKRNYRSAIASVVWFAFFFVLPALEAGARLIGDYVMNAAAVLAKVIGEHGFLAAAAGGRKPVVNSVVWANSVSLTSSVFRVTRSLHVSDVVAALVIALLLIGIVAALVWVGRRYNVDLFRPATTKLASAHVRKTNSIEWAALIVLALIFGPQTTARHMIMLMLVYVVGLALVFVKQRRGPRILLLASMIATAVALSLPFRQTGVHPALVALKSAGAASWCALLVILCIAWIGSRTIVETKRPGVTLGS